MIKVMIKLRKKKEMRQESRRVKGKKKSRGERRKGKYRRMRRGEEKRGRETSGRRDKDDLTNVDFLFSNISFQGNLPV